MDTLTRMMTILGDTGLYRVTEDSFIASELRAYAAGLRLVEEKLETLQRERFLPTAEDEGLRLLESVTGRELESADLDARRAMLMYRLSITPNDFTLLKIQQALLAAGIEGSVSEDTQGLYINVLRLLRTDISENNVQTAAAAFLPAHLPCTFDFGTQSFDLLDAQDLTWSARDGQDKTWAEFDG